MMKNILITSLLGLMLLSFTNSCNKKSITDKKFFRCAEEVSHDTLKIQEELIGSWQWAEKMCYWEGEHEQADKKVIVTFDASKLFVVMEGASIKAMGSYTFTKVDHTYWALKLAQPSAYLYGKIWVCKNRLMFNQSYIDGCDHTFEKAQH